MLFHPDDPSCYLIQLSDFQSDPMPEPVQRFEQPLRSIIRWAREYLVKPHADLGRPGPVCPYVHRSMEMGAFLLGVCEGNPDQETVRSLLMRYRDWFIDLEPRDLPSAQLKTIVIIFPELPPERVPEIIDVTQQQLKPHYVSEGMMIGEFHPGPPQKAGLWNHDFRPLRSPLPLLAMRNLVPTDFPFLAEEPHLVRSYITRIGDAIPVHLRQAVAEARLKHGLALDD